MWFARRLVKVAESRRRRCCRLLSVDAAELYQRDADSVVRLVEDITPHDRQQRIDG